MKTRLKLSLAAAFAIGLALSCPVSSTAQTVGPTAIARIGGEEFNLSDFISVDGDVVFLQNTSLTGSNGNALTVGFTGLTDPFINFSLSATNVLPVTDTFELLINVPITACPPGSTVNASISYSLTAGTTLPAQITPVAPATFTGDPLVNGVSAGIPVGPAASTNSTTATQFGPPTVGFTNSFVSGAAVNTLGIDVLFNLTGGFTQVGITGRVECIGPTAVPEPGTFALLVGGGMPLGLLAVRRLRRRA